MQKDHTVPLLLPSLSTKMFLSNAAAVLECLPVSADMVDPEDKHVWEPSPAARRRERNRPQKAALPTSVPASQKPQGQPSSALPPAKAGNAWQGAAGSGKGPGALSCLPQDSQQPGQHSLQPSPQPEVGATASGRAHTEQAGKAPAWQSRARLSAQHAPEASPVAGLESRSGGLSSQLSDDFPVLSGATALAAVPSSSGAAAAPTAWTSPGLPMERESWEEDADLNSEQVLRDLGVVSLEETATPPEHPAQLPDKLALSQWSDTSRREDLEEVNYVYGPPQRPRPWPSHHLSPLYARIAGFHNPHSSIFSGG